MQVRSPWARERRIVADAPQAVGRRDARSEQGAADVAPRRGSQMPRTRRFSAAHRPSSCTAARVAVDGPGATLRIRNRKERRSPLTDIGIPKRRASAHSRRILWPAMEWPSRSVVGLGFEESDLMPRTRVNLCLRTFRVSWMQQSKRQVLRRLFGSLSSAALLILTPEASPVESTGRRS